MQLGDLVSGQAQLDRSLADRAIAGLTMDSRKVAPGFLFVAVSGTKADGLAFVPQAISAGAVAIMAERAPAGLPPGVAFVQVANARRALAQTAARFYAGQPRTIAAVTGTSGKTSVAAFTRQIWTVLGHSAASIGTVGVVSPMGEIYGSLTTPDPVELHHTLDALCKDGVTHLAIEASSHGLDQYRLDGLSITAAAFTNITRDHLDYHCTFEAYLAAKTRLFTELLSASGTAVVDMDHDHAEVVLRAAETRGVRTLTVGRCGKDLRLVSAVIDGFAQHIEVEFEGRLHRVGLPLVGHFQVENALVAAGLVIATGGDVARVLEAFATLRGAKGRLERVGERNGAPIFVDYAHKPDALAKALEALRPYAKRALVVVFGCGGDRDRGKRPLMGAIAAEKADRVIVTDDNPRNESPAAIRAEILKAAPTAREIGNRGEAIREAVRALREGDVLLIAGKGHESGQIVGEAVLPFTDHDAVKTALGDITE